MKEDTLSSPCIERIKTFDPLRVMEFATESEEVVQSVFLASTLANNGVATWEDDYPGSAYIASFAYRFKDQLDKRPLSEVAIFYPHASVEHNQPIQANDEVLLGGQHYWYLGLGYLMAGLNLNYDVLYAGDGLVREDSFEAPSPRIMQLSLQQKHGRLQMVNSLR